MPLILGTDGAKLSKRHGGVSVEEYKRAGFLPEALANYLVLLGWMPRDGREMMPLAEAVRLFEIGEMNDVQAKFDIQKLRWLNSEYITKMPDGELLPLIKGHLAAAGIDPAGIADGYLARVLGLYKVRLKTLKDFPVMTESFFRDDFVFEEEGKAQLEKPESREFLTVLADRLSGLEPFTREAVERVFREFVEERKIKAGLVIHPARMAVSGKTKGAGLFEMMEVLGKERTVERMRRAAHG
jgi:glutamyl/glutaminyl-tRNA synthetase